MLHMRFRYFNIRMRKSRRLSALGSAWFKLSLEKYFFSAFARRLVRIDWWWSGIWVDNDYDTLAVASECRCCSAS